MGGVRASLKDKKNGLVDNWLRNIKDVFWNNRYLIESAKTEKELEDLLVEMNVKQQVQNIAGTGIVQDAWAEGKKLRIHGWVYQLDTGMLKEG